MTREILVGTRDSALALWQTNWVVEQLKKLNSSTCFRIIHIKTQGDKVLDVALAKIGDKGLFTKELELAMLNGEIDFAVHSMKDLPTVLPDGLTIGAITKRVDPRDVVISFKGYNLASLPKGARVGTSSLRRKAQLLHFRNDLTICDLRGNLQTRIRKMHEQDLDAIILASAGVERLGWDEHIVERLPIDIVLPAVGQGAIGIEIRTDDTEIMALVQQLHHEASAAAITAERALLARLEGGCQIPIGALAIINNDLIDLEGLVAGLDGNELIRSCINGSMLQAERLGVQLAEQLLQLGAGKILMRVRQDYNE